MEQNRGPQEEDVWYSSTVEAITAQLGTSSEIGLTPGQVLDKRQLSGWNELPEAPPLSWVRLFLSQFTSIIIWVLIVAAVVSGLMEDWLDAAVILAIVFLNGVLGFVQEFRAERSLAALKQLSVDTAQVIREGALRSIPARELVKGD